MVKRRAPSNSSSTLRKRRNNLPTSKHFKP
jgi:hypothetical protein